MPVLGRSLFDQNTGRVLLVNFQDKTGAFITGAVVIFDLIDEAGTVLIDDESMPYLGTPVTIDGVTYADGNYEGPVVHSTTFSKDADGKFDCHYIEVTATVGAEQYFARMQVYVSARDGTD